MQFILMFAHKITLRIKNNAFSSCIQKTHNLFMKSFLNISIYTSAEYPTVVTENASPQPVVQFGWWLGHFNEGDRIHHIVRGVAICLILLHSFRAI